MGVERGVEHDGGHAEHAVHGGANLVAHGGQKRAARFSTVLGFLLGHFQLAGVADAALQHLNAQAHGREEEDPQQIKEIRAQVVRVGNGEGEGGRLGVDVAQRAYRLNFEAMRAIF